MSCGTPVIASDLPGMRVPVLKTGCGLLVHPASHEELAAALIAILEKPESYRGQPEALVRLSTPEAVAQEYEKVFELVQDRTRLKQALMNRINCPSDPIL